ncbi:MAG: Glu/Leu/Phe/Val dehydrogenase [Bdellovibrionales bacterium]|nr:Glu/Leu/Phe/Val dehydrogenase [Bdellovibrionales bacterium]
MVFKYLEKKNKSHEKVIFCFHPETKLKAIVAIHSTTLGPALGGCRMLPYETEEKALEDVLNLSEAMSYKAAMAGLQLGGGKSIIIGDPNVDKTPEMLWTFGIYLNSLSGQYITAKDMGITIEDLQYIGDQTSYVVGRPIDRGGAGDPSQFTATGVYYGIKKAVQLKLKRNSLKDLKVIVQGIGAVGSFLVKLLYQDDVEVLVYDINESAMIAMKEKFPKVKILSREEVFKRDCDIFAPCSIGAIVNDKTVETLKCSIIAGGANNQLSDLSIAEKLQSKNILYIPDFVINSGGLIYVSSYLDPKKSEEWIRSKIKAVSSTIEELCKISFEDNVSLVQMAFDLAQKKIKRGKI